MLTSFALLLVFFGILVLFFFLVFVLPVRILAYAYRKIGVRPRYMFAVLLLTLLGSWINVPLFSMGSMIVAINVGGALVPVLLSLYLFVHLPLRGRMLVGTAIVAAIVHSLAQIVPGAGIAVPMLVPPLAAAGVSLLLSYRQAPPVAYVAGSMGTLIGADLLNLHRIAEIGAPLVSIGGAGTFDGVFLTGIIAGLLV
jgi:uncharacterized membrane protein